MAVNEFEDYFSKLERTLALKAEEINSLHFTLTQQLEEVTSVYAVHSTLRKKASALGSLCAGLKTLWAEFAREMHNFPQTVAREVGKVLG
jgi:septal ring factor EnvC (AmiA/AmiB activator)